VVSQPCRAGPAIPPDALPDRYEESWSCSDEELAAQWSRAGNMGRDLPGCPEEKLSVSASRLGHDPGEHLDLRGRGNSGWRTLLCRDVYHLAIEAMKYAARLRSQASDVIDGFNRKLYEHQIYIRENLKDMPEIAHWQWTRDFSDA